MFLQNKKSTNINVLKNALSIKNKNKFYLQQFLFVSDITWGIL